MIDKGLIEMFGPYGFTTIFSYVSQQIIMLQTGYIYHYSLLILIRENFDKWRYNFRNTKYCSWGPRWVFEIAL